MTAAAHGLRSLSARIECAMEWQESRARFARAAKRCGTRKSNGARVSARNDERRQRRKRPRFSGMTATVHGLRSLSARIECPMEREESHARFARAANRCGTRKSNGARVSAQNDGRSQRRKRLRFSGWRPPRTAYAPCLLGLSAPWNGRSLTHALQGRQSDAAPATL